MSVSTITRNLSPARAAFGSARRPSSVSRKVLIAHRVLSASLPRRLLLLVQFQPLAGLRPGVLLERRVGQRLLLELDRLVELSDLGVRGGERVQRRRVLPA